MAQGRAPGLYIETVTPPEQTVSPLRTDIAGFVGLAARGPAGQAVAVTGWEQFQALYGKPLPGLYLAHAARAFFECGGRMLYVVRVAAPGALASSAVVAGEAGPALLVEAGSVGAWAEGLTVTVTPCRRGAVRTAAWAPDGAWVQVDSSPVGFSAGSVVSWGTGAAVVARVEGRRLWWREPVSPVPAEGGLLETREFHLAVRLGSEREEYRFLGTDPAHPYYYGSRVGSSGLVRLSPALSGLSSVDQVPVGGSVTLSGGTDAWDGLALTDFTAGLDLLAALPQVSIVAVPDVTARRPPAVAPVPVFEPPSVGPVVSPPAVCGCPAPAATPTPPKAPVVVEPAVATGPGEYLLSETAQQSLREALIEHAELQRDRFAIVDPPPGLDPQGVMAWREGLDSKYAAVYYPWLMVGDSGGSRGGTVWVPPSGHAAGLYARTDLGSGVHRAPANVTIPGVLAMGWEVRDADQALLNPLGINCLRLFPGQGFRVWGARTLSSDAAWRFVPVRRLMIMIEKAVVEATPWAVFEPHNLKLRFQVVNSIATFLQDLWRRGALAGSTPEEAFYVKCDAETNPPDVVDAGMLVTEVGVACVRPAEFVVVRLERSRDAVQVREVELA
jgi:uncharacterized protein